MPVEVLAERAGAVIRYEPFDGKLSGMLYRSKEGAVIGVDSLHPTARQRFSIAHEIGHLLLHQPELHVDEHAFIAFRDLQSSTASDPVEIEANQFAAALLMPAEILRKSLMELGNNPDVPDAIHSLAQSCQVSQEGIVKLTLRPAQCRDAHSPAPLPSASLSARHHQPCRLALPQILHELPGC